MDCPWALQAERSAKNLNRFKNFWRRNCILFGIFCRVKYFFMSFSKPPPENHIMLLKAWGALLPAQVLDKKQLGLLFRA